MVGVLLTVELPNDQIEFLDSEIAAGRAPSRSAAIAGALRREQRRRRAEQDLQTALEAGDDPDIPALQNWSSHRSYGDLGWRNRL